MFDWFLENWNDLFTALAFLISCTVAIFQIQYYRSQSADLSIIDIQNAHVNERGEERSWGTGMKYNLGVQVQNDGRDLATVSGASLELDNGEEIELYNVEISNWSNVDVKTRETIVLKGIHHGKDKNAAGTLKLETTDGELKERVLF